MASLPYVDVVIACYNETEAAVSQTVRACIEQDHAPAMIWVIDDGSPDPVTLSSALIDRDGVHVIRRTANGGISAARNHGVSMSSSTYVLCINCEVVPRRDWIRKAVAFLERRPHVGAVCGQVLPVDSDSLLSRWRVHFQENPETRTDRTRKLDFAAGHAVLFRSSAFDAVDGYDERLRRTQEDSDISHRLQQTGFTIYQVEGLRCTSYQRDSIALCASKSLRNNGWTVEASLQDDRVLRPVRLGSAFLTETVSLVWRLVRNIVSLRVSFLHIDVAVYLYTLFLIARHTIRL